MSSFSLKSSPSVFIIVPDIFIFPLEVRSSITIGVFSSNSELTPAGYFTFLVNTPLFPPTNLKNVGLALSSLSIDKPKANKPNIEESF